MKNLINKLLYIITITILCYTCKFSDKNTKSMNAMEGDIEVVKQRVVAGDSIAYKKLVIMLLDYPPEESLKWALFFSDKYNYSLAHRDVYYACDDLYSRQYGKDWIKKIDSKTKNMIKKHLEIAYKNGCLEAKDYLNEF